MSLTVTVTKDRAQAFLDYLRNKGLRSIFELTNVAKRTATYRRKV